MLLKKDHTARIMVMRHFLLPIIICIALTPLLFGVAARKCELMLKPLWQELQDKQERTITFKGKWILAGTITFRKKILDVIELDKIVLSWHGKRIDSLNASLYSTEINRPFRAIENNWVSDGQWNAKTQQLTFKFSSKCTLCAITTFYLVLTVPPLLEPTLKKGSFTLETYSLPSQYQDIHQEARVLSFNILPPGHPSI